MVDEILSYERLHVTAVQLKHGGVGGVERRDVHVGQQLARLSDESLEDGREIGRKPTWQRAALRRRNEELEYNISKSLKQYLQQHLEQ